MAGVRGEREGTIDTPGVGAGERSSLARIGKNGASVRLTAAGEVRGRRFCRDWKAFRRRRYVRPSVDRLETRGLGRCLASLREVLRVFPTTRQASFNISTIFVL